jgi:putative SOS response-associated peptidase YedK
MCSRYQTPDALEMSRYFRAELTQLPQFKPTIYPGYQTPAVINHQGQGTQVEARFWGFVLNLPGKRNPNQTVAKILQNAVSETISEKRTFSKAWRDGQRCILPATLFFEPIEGRFRGIHDPDHEILGLAGIYADQTHKEKLVKACTMLTCEPNAWMASFHDRMPVILHPRDFQEWLSPDTAPENAQRLCRPWTGKLALAANQKN